MRPLLLTPLLALTLGASAQADAPVAKTPTAATLNLLGPGVGVEGFDPVSYWPEGGSKPVQGTIKLTFMHEGVAYRFANERNLAIFKANPGHVLPQ